MIGTGGTIASTPTEYGLAPGLTPADILSYIPAVRQVCEVDTIQVCNLDSTNVTPKHWQLLVRTVQEHYEEYDGFVVCHGTDTLAYTAAALSYMIQNSGKPIVITGAQKPIQMDVTDARTNLLDSFIYAADEEGSNHCPTSGILPSAVRTKSRNWKGPAGESATATEITLVKSRA